MIKAILFDLDDTLIKTFETKKEALKDLGREYYHVELTDEVIKSHWGKPIRPLLKSLYKNINNIEEAVERYILKRKKYPTSAYEDTLSTLKKLSKKYLLGVITSKSKRYIKDDLELSVIPEDLFFLVQTEEKSMTHKPNPDVFNYVLNQLKKKGIVSSEILYIGDSLSDYYAARDAGLGFYGIPDRTTPKKEFDKQGAETITKLSELLSLLEDKNGSGSDLQHD